MELQETPVLPTKRVVSVLEETCSGMTIGSAVVLMRRGRSIRRAVWDPDLYLALFVGPGRDETIEMVGISSTTGLKFFISRWSPNPADLTATDWLAVRRRHP